MTHICFDWDGTIAKKEAVEEANRRRCETLGISIPLEKLREMQKTHAHYEVTRKGIQDYTGIKDKREQTIIMTDLLKIHYTAVAHEMGQKMFYAGMLNVIKKLHKEEMTLSVATTLRQEIIDHVMVVLGIRNLFGAVYGNTPDLIYKKDDMLKKALTDCGEVHLMVGDREEDMKAGRAVKAKTAFAGWGHGELADKRLADIILKKPQDLYAFAKTL